MMRLGRAQATGSINRWIRNVRSEKITHWTSLSVTFTGAIIGLVAVIALYISFTSAPGFIGAMGAGLALVMLAIAIIDWLWFTIPDRLNAVGLVLGIMHAVLQQPNAMLQASALTVLRGTIVALIFLALRYSYAQLRRRQGLGLGDVKLAFVAGAWLDWLMIPIAIQLAAFAALSVYLLRRLISGQPISATSRMPFGLFFAPAIWICWVIEARWFAV